MTEVYMDAFASSEYTYWWGPTPVMWPWQEERIRRRFADPSTQQFKVVDDASGAVVAWAKWDPPPQMTGLREGFVVYGASDGSGGTEQEEGASSSSGETSAKSYALGPPEGSHITLFHDFFDRLVKMEKKWQAEEKLVLTHLCTRHSYHGRGLGAALLRGVLDLADTEGLPAYLEASPAGLSLYKRLGFETVDMLKFDRSETGCDTPATLHVMVREPRAV